MSIFSLKSKTWWNICDNYSISNNLNNKKFDNFEQNILVFSKILEIFVFEIKKKHYFLIKRSIGPITSSPFSISNNFSKSTTESIEWVSWYPYSKWEYLISPSNFWFQDKETTELSVLPSLDVFFVYSSPLYFFRHKVLFIIEVSCVRLFLCVLVFLCKTKIKQTEKKIEFLCIVDLENSCLAFKIVVW